VQDAVEPFDLLNREIVVAIAQICRERVDLALRDRIDADAVGQTLL
jgi:hypothetical protein